MFRHTAANNKYNFNPNINDITPFEEIVDNRNSSKRLIFQRKNCDIKFNTSNSNDWIIALFRCNSNSTGRGSGEGRLLLLDALKFIRKLYIDDSGTYRGPETISLWAESPDESGTPKLISYYKNLGFNSNKEEPSDMNGSLDRLIQTIANYRKPNRGGSKKNINKKRRKTRKLEN
jgi:hypothetical protein